MKLLKLNAYEGFWYDFEHIINEIMDENLNVLTFRSHIKGLIYKIIKDVTDYEYSYFVMLSSLNIPIKFISHSLNTAIFSYIIALNLNVSTQMIYKIIQAALLHDIGKLSFSETIREMYIEKNEDPAQIVMNHPLWGERIITNHLKADPDIARLVASHHEQNDGSGYPKGINGTNLTVYEHIIITANMVDLVLQKTNYPGIENLAKNLDKIFMNRGHQFVPEIMESLHDFFRLKNEGRHFKRFRVSAKGRIANESDSINTICDVVNISSGGIEVRSPIILNPGIEYKVNTKVDAKVYINDEKCEVMWNGMAEGKFIYGMRFEDREQDISTKLMSID
jgi:hypothetical protein